MHTRFSERNNLVPEKEIQLASMDTKLTNRLWNIFNIKESRVGSFEPYGIHTKPGKPEIVMDSLGLTYIFPNSRYDTDDNIKKLKQYLCKAEWYVVYEFIESYVECFDTATEKKAVEKEFNIVLEEEKSGYRILKGLVVPITNEIEIKALTKSLSTPYDAVNTHLKKALQLYAKRQNPDYENSIKESISAVEALCSAITGITGAQATLGKTIKKLKDNGIHIHPAMESAYTALYGYTSDENGIRHGSIDFSNAPAEDAKYMLMSCSAFVNYLIEKWSKASK